MRVRASGAQLPGVLSQRDRIVRQDFDTSNVVSDRFDGRLAKARNRARPISPP
jgi:hypothetical protein